MPRKEYWKKRQNYHNLKQRFDLVKTLGQGTYGKVKLAVDRTSGIQFAIKTIKKLKIGNVHDMTRIHREIEIMTNLSHPHITSVYEVFENSEKIILVMEYASGGELYDFINEKQGLYEEEARNFFRQIVSAAYYLHMNGIVHRDLKLENIVLDRKGQAMIADFGLSNVYNKDEMLNTYCGSPLYASPEIVNGLPYTGPEVDCWSLGVLLFTLVYGAMPFDGSDFRQLRNQITSGHYYEPDKASEAAGLIRFMLTPNPAKRATVRDICDHWWTNFGYDCTPDEETRPGKPVNLVALEKSLSASHSSSDATEDLVKNKPIKGILKKSKNKKEYKQCLDVMNKGTYTTETDLSDGVDKCILLSEDKKTTSHDMNSLNGDQSAFTLTSSKTKANYSKEPEKKGILKKSQDYSNKHPGSGYINEKVGEVVDKHTLTLMLDCTVVDHCTTSGIIKENVEEPCDDGSFWKVGEDGDHIGDVESTLYIDELHLFDYEQPIENSHSGSASASKLCGSPGDQEIQANYQNVAGTAEKLPETELKRIKLAETPISDQSFFQNARNTARELFDSIRSSAPAQSIRGILKGNTHFSNGGDPSWRNTLGSSGSSSSGDLLEFSYDSWEGDTGLSGEKKVRPAYSLPPQNLTKSEDPSLLKQLADQCLSTAQRVDVEEEYVPSPPLPNSVPPSLDTLGGSSDNIDTNHEPGEICFDKSDYEPGEIILSDENGTSKICFGFNSEETINRILRDDYDPSEKEKRADGSQSIQSS